MDDSIEVDELFGDADIDLPLSTPLGGLPQKIHDVQTSGCSQTIAWSKTGCIAYVSQDGTSVKLAYLTCNPSTGTWDLKDEVTAQTNHAGQRIVHLQWNQSSLFDLAIVDAMGRVSTIQHSWMALNSTSPLRRASLDQDNDLNQPVGMYWFNRERPSMTFLPSSKENRWTFLPTRKISFGPYHNMALVVVTKSGNLRLLYQQTPVAWKTTSASLRRMSSTSELVTHAAIGSMKDGSLLVAMQTYDCKLHTFRVKVEFVQEKGQPENIKHPIISVDHIQENISTGIFKEPDAALLGEATLPTYSVLNLSYLEIIQTSDVERTVQVQPIILGVYSAGINSMGMHSYTNGSPCMVVRWQLSVMQTKLHSSFDEISSKGGDAQPKQKLGLVRLDDIQLPQVVTSVQQIDGGLISMVFGDGSIHIYDPIMMNDLYNEYEMGKATTLSRAGFSFQGMQSDTSGLSVALSPNGCMAAVMDDEGKVRCRELRLWQPHQSEEEQELGMETAVHSIALSFARGFIASLATDDLIKTFMEQFSDREDQLLGILYRTLFNDADFTNGLDSLAKKTFISKVLSVQAAFGFRAGDPSRNVSSAFCWTTMNIRHIYLGLLLILTFAKQDGDAYREPDLLSTLLHNIHYAQSLFAYLINNLFSLASKSTSTSPSSADQDLTTLLLLSCWSRFFLRHTSRALRGIALIPQNPQYNISPKALPAFNRIASAIDPTSPYSSAATAAAAASGSTNATPVKTEAVERLLVGIDKFVTQAYESAGLSDNARANVERQMLATARIPDVLNGIMGRIVREILPTTRKEVNRLDVWEMDYDWLGIWGHHHNTPTTAPPIDVHKKRRIPTTNARLSGAAKPAERKVRRCTRCGEFSEDLVPGKALPHYLRNQIAKCVCEGSFVVERLDGGGGGEGRGL